MGKMLLLRIAGLYSLLAIFFLTGVQSSLQAQIAITDARQFEVMFTDGQTQIQRQFARISVGDIPNVLGENYEANFELYDRVPDASSGYYVRDRSGVVAVHGLKTSGASEEIYARLSFSNQSGASFDGLSLAFDFLSAADDGEPFRLQLQYRINQENWRDVPGGTILSSELPSNRNEWSSFSIQSRIDDLFLRDGDNLFFQWVQQPDQFDQEQRGAIPLAIQGVDLMPSESRRTAPSRGSLIITEILPSSPTGVGQVEYLELYNPTEEEVSLKGIEIVTNSGEVVIQEEIYIEPYDFTVLAGPMKGESNFVNARYVYGRSVITPDSRFINLQFEGEEIARATFEASSPGVALELDRAANAYDGYTSLQNLQPAVAELSTSVRGTPGTSGETRRLFSRTFTGSGWNLVAVPGFLHGSLNRFARAEYRSLYDAPFSSSDYQPGEPFLMKPEPNQALRLFAEEDMRGQQSFGRISVNPQSDLISAPEPGLFSMNSLVNDLGQPVTPAALRWNADRQNFHVVYRADDELDGWAPMIVHSDVSTPSRLLDRDATSGSDQLARYFNFRLFLEEGRRGDLQVVDESLLGFWDLEDGSRNQRFDLPKFYPFPDESGELNALSMLYLTNSQSRNRTTSFTHLPFNPEQEYRIGMSAFTTRGSSAAAIDWSLAEGIPDEWIITLEDHVTGAKIDMREQSDYTFRLAGTDPSAIAENALEPFTTVIPDESERFTISIKPYMASSESYVSEEQPGSVELRPNYPNPFNPSTNIAFYLPEERPVRVGVYNIVGQQVALLMEETAPAGEHTLVWNAADMPSGIYIVQLETGSRIMTRKITLIK
jgi:hypothetical protein